MSNSRQILLSGIITLLTLGSCNERPSFSLKDASNPWKDNYTELVPMEHYKEWGTYNVHDPACKKIGDTYYMYSTDAIFGEDKKRAEDMNVPLGFIQVRKSKDLVNWEFVGWAFPEIPKEAIKWVHSQANGKGAGNIWAPYIIPYNNIYRLYYSVSAFGRNTSYIGMAESDSPEGPWIQKGAVVKTGKGDNMNAIDPSIIEDHKTGKWWMHYGSYFGGLFCVELDPATGLAKKENDKGHLIARRANYKKDNLEAPEIMYNKELDKYYLFTSYDPLMTTYNVRVAMADAPEGPFFDYNGFDIKDTTNNLPILTAPYQFENHPGWAGTAHCGIIDSGDGQYFMIHQGRLSPRNHMMALHLREMFFTENGWPVVSPQRYVHNQQQVITYPDFYGEWEIIRITEPPLERGLEAGQILWGEGDLIAGEQAKSTKIVFEDNGRAGDANWTFNKEKQTLDIVTPEEHISDLKIFIGHDWENEKETILFTGLDSKGCTIWGKRVK